MPKALPDNPLLAMGCNPTAQSAVKPAFPRLPVRSRLCYLAVMSATQVIEEIKHLPRDEQSAVLRFAFEMARERQLPGKKLSHLAQQMANAHNPAEVKKLRDEIHRGFYGE
jgi:hypothetical protein